MCALMPDVRSFAITEYSFCFCVVNTFINQIKCVNRFMTSLINKRFSTKKMSSYCFTNRESGSHSELCLFSVFSTTERAQLLK